ncbi:flagellar motor switch protein FliG [Heliophilum fasciatum]|uniref:Flagellar motor switch protein FliG n=1 Tax=Heliophilum fasciatum TaxID=35700 RepID=A0A4V2SX12_9FIRM|nr:flagellar motor switch protein FliG [Heliophilum fasciatum]MCW2277944.1 flagellar motor switch protein FliG [Heliophilum fasciatum]TCP64486.1 flagellar motor switch protein FliG [Heliophilum fasciatum]
MATAKPNLTGKQKAAILLISLGPEKSANVFKHLKDEEIEQMTLEIATIRKVPPENRDAVLEEFNQLYMATEYINNGGIDYAKEILEKAVGSQKAIEIINRLTASLQVRPFEFVRRTDPAQLLNFIQSEHPQTIALILAYLSPDQASVILSALPPERQCDVARRIALMDRTSPEVIREVEMVLERKLSSLVTQEQTVAGGIDAVVEMLNRVDRSTEKAIIESLEVQDPELAEEVKKRMFVFEDIVLLDDRGIQQVLREVDTKDLALALKGSSDDVAQKIFKNVSKRAADMLREDMEFMGPVRLRDVEDAQQRIVNVIRRLEDSGEIIIARGGGDELIV